MPHSKMLLNWMQSLICTKVTGNVSFLNFKKERKKNADAIADLAIDNYYEMRDHVANESLSKKRIIEMALEREFPSTYFSKYSLVTFNEHLGYHQAMTKGRAQDKVLLKMIEEREIKNTTPTKKKILEEVQNRSEKLLNIQNE